MVASITNYHPGSNVLSKILDIAVQGFAGGDGLLFGGVLNGGICGALLDCHSNWCAVTTLMKERGLDLEALLEQERLFQCLFEYDPEDYAAMMEMLDDTGDQT